MISIISNDCWGTGVYRYLESEYFSPFINAYIHSPDYLRLISNLDFYLYNDLKFIDSNLSKYKTISKPTSKPNEKIIFTLKDDIEIVFAHNYIDKSDVQEKWLRRLKRMEKNTKVLYKYGDIYETYGKHIDYGNNEVLLKEFHSLKYDKKISFTINQYDYENNFKILDDLKNCTFTNGLNVEKYLDLKKYMDY